jgi:hypothetical protein
MSRVHFDYMWSAVVLWAARRSLGVSIRESNFPTVKMMAIHCEQMQTRHADAAEALQHARAGR